MADSSDPYHLIEHEEFLAQVRRVVGSVQRWDEIKWAESWLLERNPKAGQYLPARDMWALYFRSYPPMVAYYLVDDVTRTVTLVGMYFVDG